MIYVIYIYVIMNVKSICMAIEYNGLLVSRYQVIIISIVSLVLHNDQLL